MGVDGDPDVRIPILGAALAGMACPSLAACDDAGCEAAAAYAPTCDIGSGSAAYEQLAEGGPIEVVRGPQGGYHVFGSLRVGGLSTGEGLDLSDPGNPSVTFSVDGVSGLLGGYTGLQRVFTPAGDGLAELFGEVLILDIDSPEQIVGTEAILRAEVTDSCGTTVSAERHALFVDEEE